MRSYVVGPSFAALLLVSTEGWCEQPRTQELVVSPTSVGFRGAF